VKRQYIGNLGKIENGIVAVTAYGLINNITVPLLFEVYPKNDLNQRIATAANQRLQPE